MNKLDRLSYCTDNHYVNDTADDVIDNREKINEIVESINEINGNIRELGELMIKGIKLQASK